MFLFFMTFNGPRTEDSIPHGNPLPYEVRQWTSGSHLPTMGTQKAGYFGNPVMVRRSLKQHLQPHWRPSSAASDVVYHLIYGAYCLLWDVKPVFACPALENRTPEAFIEYLENWLTAHPNLPF